MPKNRAVGRALASQRRFQQLWSELPRIKAMIGRSHQASHILFCDEFLIRQVPLLAWKVGPNCSLPKQTTIIGAGPERVMTNNTWASAVNAPPPLAQPRTGLPLEALPPHSGHGSPPGQA